MVPSNTNTNTNTHQHRYRSWCSPGQARPPAIESHRSCPARPQHLVRQSPISWQRAADPPRTQTFGCSAPGVINFLSVIVSGVTSSTNFLQTLPASKIVLLEITKNLIVFLVFHPKICWTIQLIHSEYPNVDRSGLTELGIFLSW